MLTVLYGTDTRSVQGALKRVLAADTELREQPVPRIDGSTITWPALREAVGARSLFTARQVLVVKDLLISWSARGESDTHKAGSKPTAAEFAEFATKLPDASDLILIEGDISVSNRYLKALTDKPHGGVHIREFAIPRDPARRADWTANWIANLVKENDGSIDERAARLLARRTGVDFERAANEIAKLLAYTSPQCRIGVTEVELLIADDSEASGFELVDAVCAKNQARVVDLVDRVLSEGMAPEQILALMSTRVRDLHLLVSARTERVQGNAVAATFGWSSGRLGNLERVAVSFKATELRDAQDMLVSADLALKSRPSLDRPLILLLLLLAIARRANPPDLARALAY